MSLKTLSKKIQASGRGKDSLLVHMSPREVDGLQKLAKIKGGALTTNPDTGLPEAGFLEDILPMVAAGAAMYFTAGAATPLLMSAGMGATSAGILAGAGAGAVIGGGSAAIQGGDVGQGALIGGTTGAVTSGIGSAMGGAPVDPNVALQQSTQVGTQAIGVNPATGGVIDPLAGAGNTFSYNPAGEMVPSNYAPQITGSQNPQVLTSGVGTPPTSPNPADIGKSANQLAGDRLQQQEAARAAAAQKDPNASWWSKQSAAEKAGYSTLGAGLVAGLNAPPNDNGAPADDYTSSLQRISPNFRAQEPVRPNPYYRAQYPTYAAEGGLMDAYQSGGPVERMSQMNTSINPQGGMYPQGMVDKTQYAVPTQRPSSFEVIDAGAQQTFAGGGIADLGGYSDGGRMLKGPGDGMSDSIPGVIGGKQPARLADGEFVVPADVVSHMGNGSTDAGAKKLYAMMAKVRKARTGKKKQAPAVNTSRFLPA